MSEPPTTRTALTSPADSSDPRVLQGGGEFPSLPFVPPDVLVRMHSQYSDQAALLDANDARHVEYHGDDGDFQVPYGAFTAALLDPDQVRAQHAMLLTERGGFWKCCVPCRRRAIWKFYRTQNDLIEALADAYTGGPEEEADEETTLLTRVNQSSTAAAAAAAAATTPLQPPPTEDDVATFAEDPDALVDGGEEGGAAAAEKSTKEAVNDEEDCPSGSVVPPSTTSAAAVAVSQEEASKSCCARACACWSSPVDLMVNISFAANVLLLVIKVIAAVWSGSLSVIASTIDSFLDLFSGSIIFATNCLAKRRDVLKFPVGRTRLEPLGVLIFSAVMAMSMASILIEGTTILISGKWAPVLDWVTGSIVMATIAIKLVLYILCSIVKKAYPNAVSLDALVEDHFNDCLTNTVGTAGFAVSASVNLLWFADPVLAIALALYIIYSWSVMAWEQIMLLTGKIADREVLWTLTLLAYNHHPLIVKVDTIRAWHAGVNVWAQVDIVLPPSTPLQLAHDIGESLEIKIEALECVERAFVHLDFEWLHKPEHRDI